MPEARKRPCTICRQWFRPDPRIGRRQRACGKPECRTLRRQKTQASWRKRNPEYGAAYRIQQRALQRDPVAEPLRMAAPLNQVPWGLAKDQFGAEGADFIAIVSGLLLRSGKHQFRAYVADSGRVSGTLPASAEKTRGDCGQTEARAHATGVSSTGAAMGAPAVARAAPAAATNSVAG